jgi:hypothetical protein
VKLGQEYQDVRRAAAGAPLKILHRRRRQKLNGALPPPINKGRRAAAQQMASAWTSSSKSPIHPCVIANEKEDIETELNVLVTCIEY